MPEPDPAELEVLHRGIPVRFVYDDAAVRSPTIIARRRAEITAGEQARITSEVPVHLLLVGSNLALMPLSRDRLRTDGLLVVHPCALLDALAAARLRHFQLAAPSGCMRSRSVPSRSRSVSRS